MVHHLVLYKLKPEVDEEKMDHILRETRMRLLKIPEAAAVRCGRGMKENQAWPIFVAVEVESPGKLAMFLSDPIFIKYRDEVIQPHIADSLILDHETEPGRNARFS